MIQNGIMNTDIKIDSAMCKTGITGTTRRSEMNDLEEMIQEGHEW